MKLNIKKWIILLGAMFLSFAAHSATIDGRITTQDPSLSEYQASTDGLEGSEKWRSKRRRQSVDEYDDASGGNDWDINYLGTSVVDGKFQFGVVGGKILSGLETGNNIFLGDFAISLGGHTDPTLNSNGFEYAIRLLNTNDNDGTASFALLKGDTWDATDLYSRTNHMSETYRMGGTYQKILEFNGNWAKNGGDDNVLEAEFDLSFLGLFDSATGGTITTYLTMACVNDEAMVDMRVPPAVPIPAALWLFGPALLGFMGFRRKQHA